MIVGITPARGGSKGVRRKNIRPVAGKPLLAWTIEAAQRARRLDRYIVSTEDPEVAEVARSLGAEVLERPAALATDEAPTIEVLRHVLERLPADIVVLLQATSPVRDDDLIDRCIAEFDPSKFDSLATGFLCRHVQYASSSARRQDIPGTFCDDGNVYVIRGDLILAGDRYGARRREMIIDREQNIDVDEEFDLWLAEQVLTRREASRR
jgi:CMP-N-acetylneuraminic acid synthetase